MLDGLQVVVCGEVEMELINTAHTNVLLLRQLFSQAEKFYLKLQTDISELESRYITDHYMLTLQAILTSNLSSSIISIKAFFPIHPLFNIKYLLMDVLKLFKMNVFMFFCFCNSKTILSMLLTFIRTCLCLCF